MLSATDLSAREIDDLKAQERRYDLPIEDDFVVSVLPNGIKTWVFVYAQDGRTQRRTLGVYPDMGIEGARASLDAARATRRSLQEASERSARLAATRVERRAEAPRSPAPLTAILIAAGVTGAAAMYAAWRLVAGGGTAPEPPAAAGEAVPQSPSAAAPAAEPGVPAAPGAAAPEAARSRAPASALPEAEPSGRDAGIPADPAPEAMAAASESAPAAPLEQPVAPADPERAAPSAPAPAAAAPSTGLGVTKRDPRVARALLTGDVVALEPVGELAPEIVGVPGGVERVYFYTELRGLGGTQVTYRWEREGRLEGELPVNVGASWRWRTYSRKDVPPDKTGHWRVQLLDAAGAVLAEAEFVYRNDTSRAQSAEPD
jgi:hypothetical protein